ncbi:hypothetical protein N9C67_06495 [Gammaproteobacteria bacterium]|nr:hypothetical protein [Gammaproteobacteria bacterium]
MRKNTYLSGIQITEIEGDEALNEEDVGFIVNKIYRFVDFAVYAFDTPPKIYLIANKNKGYKRFLSEIEDLSLIEIYEGDDSGKNNTLPSKDEIKNLINKNLNGLEIFDGWGCCAWLAFEYPEEEPNKSGELWLTDFQTIVGEFDAITIIGYNSKIKDNIWQQWGDGQYDEGAISNRDQADHYIGENITTQHSVSLNCLELANFKKK